MHFEEGQRVTTSNIISPHIAEFLGVATSILWQLCRSLDPTTSGVWVYLSHLKGVTRYLRLIRSSSSTSLYNYIMHYSIKQKFPYWRVECVRHSDYIMNNNVLSLFSSIELINCTFIGVGLEPVFKKIMTKIIKK